MSIESLLVKQAQLSDLRRQLKAEGCAEAEQCTLRTGRNCIEEVYRDWHHAFNEDPYSEPGFEEAWSEAVCVGDVCQHCQNVRNLKKQRMQAGREIAGVRAAITRVGRRLAKEQTA